MKNPLTVHLRDELTYDCPSTTLELAEAASRGSH